MTSSSDSKQIRFPPFRLDCLEQRLFCGDVVVPLRPKSFEVLQHLSQRPGKLVTKDEILEAVWPDTTVTDTVLKVCIREIREALRDNASQPKFIETAHRRGYRFIAETERSHSQREQHVSERTRKHQVVGREAEIARLDVLLDEALEGERQLVFVTGEPGIGKTSLVEGFLNHARLKGAFTLARGQCVEQYGAGEAYLPILEAMSRLCREREGDETLTLLRKHAPTLVWQIPSLLGEADRQLLRLEMVGATQQRMLRETAEAVEAIGAARPFVLVIEDLHWSDYSTLELLSYLARRHESARLMIIGTYRPADVMSSRHPLYAVKGELQAHRKCEEVSLSFLGEEAVIEYLGLRFPSNTFPPVLSRLIHRRTEGNPLFMINLIDLFLSRDLLALSQGEWSLTKALDHVETEVPADVRQMIENQLDSLVTEEHQILEAASCAGADFSTSSVSAALGTDVLQVEEICENLSRRRAFVHRASSSDPREDTVGRYAFIHALYQQTLYERVPLTRRIHFHRRIAETIEADVGRGASDMAAELAMHFDKARDHQHAVVYLQHAAENARRRFSNHETVELARRGLELLAKLPKTPDRDHQELLLQTSLAVCVSATEGYGSAEVEKAYSRANELCQQLQRSHELFPILCGLWRFYLIRSDLKSASEIAQKLLELAESTQDAIMLAEACLAVGTTFDNRGEFVRAKESFERGISAYNSAEASDYLSIYGHDPGIVIRSFLAWALWSLGFSDQSLAMAQEAVTLARELGHPETLCFALFFNAWVHQLRLESDLTLSCAETAIDFAKKHGMAQWIAFGSSLHGWALSKEGRSREGIKEMEDTLAIYRRIGSEISRPHFIALLAEALGDAGDASRGLTEIENGLAAVHSNGERYYEAEMHRLKGELLLQAQTVEGKLTERVKSAESCFLEAIDVARRQNAKLFELRASVSLHKLRKRHGKEEESRKMIRELYGSFSEGFETVDLKSAAALLGQSN